MGYRNLYEEFLLKNASQITSIESSLRSLTYILPGRFHDAEFASQALYATLNLIGLYHNSILRRAAQAHAIENQTAVIEESAFNKYINFWSSQSKLNSTASTLLSVISYTQVLMEMAVVRQVDKKKHYQWVAWLETLKVILRLTLYQTTQQRMTIQPTHLERDVDPASLVPVEKNGHQSAWTGKRTGMTVPSMAKTIDFNHGLKDKDAFGDVADYLLSKTLTPEKVRKPSQMVQVQKKMAKLGEIMYIIRPLIYVLSLLYWGRRSWKPWWISIIIESGSQLAIKKGYESRGGRSTMLTLEKKEYNRRLKAMLFNIMRGAFYLKITRPRLEKFCNKAENKILISMLASILRDYLPLWENIYFYTSAS
ncbi:peroxisome membrane protein [Pilobolus umbonatus]|nr:peroxisome membrane protein [Pilobolus umbonatus]